MDTEKRLYFLDNLRTFLIFLVVLVHAGTVYEASGIMGPYWIVDDPETSDLPGLLNLMLDIFVMPTIFLISGYFAASSLDRKGSWHFLKAKLRRLIAPWLIAVLTLIPAYNAIFLYSRGMPQGSWTAYFHFTNGHISMSWLWFLPVLFLFNVLYVLVRKLNLPTGKLTLNRAVVALFALGFISSVVFSLKGWYGWTKTPLIDFQNERLLIYFLVFLLGSLCFRLKIFNTEKKNWKLYAAVSATAWIPMNVYVIVLLNFFLRPGQYIVSVLVDVVLLWLGFHLAMLSLIYCAVATFNYFFNRQGVLGEALGKLSYSVYIIHVIVMAPFAVALLQTDIPVLGKYLMLTVATYVASNLLAYAYTRTVESWKARPDLKQASAEA
jgi:peptidoglycan/LPS O-acetylase OafA/YrhL